MVSIVTTFLAADMYHSNILHQNPKKEVSRLRSKHWDAAFGDRTQPLFAKAATFDLFL
jgi:hypothetical protein